MTVDRCRQPSSGLSQTASLGCRSTFTLGRNCELWREPRHQHLLVCNFEVRPSPSRSPVPGVDVTRGARGFWAAHSIMFLYFCIWCCEIYCCQCMLGYECTYQSVMYYSFRFALCSVHLRFALFWSAEIIAASVLFTFGAWHSISLRPI